MPRNHARLMPPQPTNTARRGFNCLSIGESVSKRKGYWGQAGATLAMVPRARGIAGTQHISVQMQPRESGPYNLAYVLYTDLNLQGTPALQRGAMLSG